MEPYARLSFVAAVIIGCGLPRCANTVTGVDAGVPLATTPDAVVAPRPVSPATLATVAATRPSFRWHLAPGTDGAHIDICRDRACTDVVMAQDVAGSTVAANVDLSPGLMFWRLSGRAGMVAGTAESATLPFHVGSHPQPRTPLDTNGDGFVDLVASDEGSMSTPPAVYVYFGGAMGNASTPEIVLHGAAGEAFGATLANAGDMNGDGYGDLLVASGSIHGIEGPVYLYLGSASGPDATRRVTIVPPAGALLFGTSMVGTGDVDGDGFGDVVIGAQNTMGESGSAYLYSGSATGVLATPSHTYVGRGGHFGAAIVSGDFDGDGAGDMAIGSAYTGEVRVYAGAAEPPAVVSGSGSAFGFLMGGGDFNGDGFDDLVVGSSPTSFVYLGARSGLTAATQPQSIMGNGPADYTTGLGDTNGDGFDDAHVAGGFFAGSGAGLVPMTVVLSDPAPTHRVVGIGDVNNDGFAEIAVVDEATPGITVHLGSPGGPRSESPRVVPAPIAGVVFPVAIAPAR